MELWLNIRRASGEERRLVTLVSLQIQSSLNSRHAALGFTRAQLALPDSHDFPPSFAQRAGHESITRYIAFKLWQPKVGSRFRRVTVFAPGMAMPETAVDKNGYTRLRKYEVWLAEQPRVSPPSSNLCSSKNSDQSQLCIAVTPRSDARHYAGALLCGEYVETPRSFLHGENVPIRGSELKDNRVEPTATHTNFEDQLGRQDVI